MGNLKIKVKPVSKPNFLRTNFYVQIMFGLNYINEDFLHLGHYLKFSLHKIPLLLRVQFRQVSRIPLLLRVQFRQVSRIPLLLRVQFRQVSHFTVFLLVDIYMLIAILVIL
jgi:hypothetical protein